MPTTTTDTHLTAETRGMEGVMLTFDRPEDREPFLAHLEASPFIHFMDTSFCVSVAR